MYRLASVGQRARKRLLQFFSSNFCQLYISILCADSVGQNRTFNSDTSEPLFVLPSFPFRCYSQTSNSLTPPKAILSKIIFSIPSMSAGVIINWLCDSICVISCGGRISRTLKVRGGIVSQANRSLGSVCSSWANLSASNYPGAANSAHEPKMQQNGYTVQFFRLTALKIKA